MAYKFQNWWGEGHKTLWHFLFYLWRKKGGILKPMRGREVLLLLTLYTQNLVNVIMLDIRSFKKLHYDLRRWRLAHGPKQMFFI